ncbi:MAG: DinB family protein [Bryobacterales bacterium]|nr:DinB family protein [Bryobacterales bacterium]
MAFKDTFLPEFDREMAAARKHLERVPEDKLAWKPHQKSGSMGWLAAHIADIPAWAVRGIKQDSVDLAPAGVEHKAPTPPSSRQALLELFDGNVAAAREAVAGAEDAHLAQNWSLLMKGQAIMTMPRTAVLRNFMMNHLIHHRAQLGIYLRLCEVPVPATYGPSADDAGL